jgi:hypothetical protein
VVEQSCEPGLSCPYVNFPHTRLTTHDSGSGWIATPFLCDSWIHDSTPVLSRRTPRAANPQLLRDVSPGGMACTSQRQ